MFRFQDLRHAARSLASTPTLIAVATLSVGLGVGVNTALYMVFRAVFQQTPTAMAPERLVRVEPGNGNQFAYPNIRDLVADDTFDGLAAYTMIRLNLRSGGEVEKIAALSVSPTFFEVLGLQPSRGRPIASDLDSVVITDAFWHRRLDDRLDPVGVVIVLNGRPFTVVGVLPPDYRAITGPLGPDVYVPLNEVLTPGLASRRHAFLTVVARLRAGVSTGQARAAMTSQAQVLERIHPEENAGLGRPAFVFPVSGLGSWQTRDMPVMALAGVTAVPFSIFGLVLLIACANVAGLLLARGAARQREIAIRLALGASRAQVVTTLLWESLILSLLGSVAGLLLAHWLCGLLGAIPLPQAPAPVQVKPDGAVLGFALSLTVLVTLACGLLPALASTRPRLTEALKRDGADRQRRLTSRSVLVSGQVAVAALLLFISILFVRSLHFIRDVDPGFSIDGVVTASIDLDQARYPGDARLRFAADTIEAVRAVPGVVSASMTSLIPLGGDVVAKDYVVEHGAPSRVEAYVMHVGPDYFRTMNIHLQRGREFSFDDRPEAPAFAIVNTAFVKARGLAAAPLGIRVRDSDTEPWLEIIGVVDDTKYAFFGESSHPILYRPLLQAGGRLFVVARGPGAPAALMSALKRTVTSLDPSAIVEPRTMREAISLESSVRRAGSWILGSLGGLGLGLALIGLYGVMSYSVTRRTREMGIRIALGASHRRVQWLILRNAAMLVGIGAGLGTVAAVVLTRPVAWLLNGVPVYDPWTMAATGALFVWAGLTASYVPSVRATRVDPMVALRSE